jgi:cytochrome c peroxidase
MIIPKDNPLTKAGVRLGRRLFFDSILSGERSQSCAFCHSQKSAFADAGMTHSIGAGGAFSTLNSPNIVNPGWGSVQFWDGRAANLEAQALAPVANPEELNLPWVEAMARLKVHPEYPALFQEAFGSSEPDSMLVVKAIAQFERTLISHDSKYDKWKRGEAGLTESEYRGNAIFFSERGECFRCHKAPLFTDNDFHNNGLDSVFEQKDRSTVTGNGMDDGKWKAPTLRNIAVNPPYMHDGRIATLEEVVEHYNSGIIPTPTLDQYLFGIFSRPPAQKFTDQEKTDLVAFLNCLTDSTFLTNPDFGPP